jgi:hypothetical protein
MHYRLSASINIAGVIDLSLTLVEVNTMGREGSEP